MANQFSTILVECKEWIRARGRAFRAQRAGARDALEDRRDAGRPQKYLSPVGETLVPDLAGSGRGHALRNRGERSSARISTRRTSCCRTDFLFVEGGNDDHLFLEHYVLLGNFMNDPDRFEVFDAFLLDFVREFVLAEDDAEELSKARKAHERLLEQARHLRSELARVEEEQEEAAGARERRRQVSRSFSGARRGVERERRAELEELRAESRSARRNLESSGRRSRPPSSAWIFSRKNIRAAWAII